MELQWITPRQAAKQWGITERQVQALCFKGKIHGVVRLGHSWLIPKDAKKPIDGRTKAAKHENSRFIRCERRIMYELSGFNRENDRIYAPLCCRIVEMA
jgi:hypothetical protein